jgi:ABC-type transport system involved in multi-copper enzyme maturation permease subunit
MSTLAEPILLSPSRGSVRVHPVTPARVVRSEWIKFRTLRSSWFVLGGTMLAVMAIGMITTYFDNSNWNTINLANFNPIDASLNGVVFAQLAIGVLGVLIISGEYATGMIRATLGAVPKRVPVLAAKAVVFAAISFVTCLVAVLVAFLAGQGFLSSHGVSLGAPGALRAVFGAALYLTLAGLFGMALGFLIRSTAGGIAALVGVLLILPVVFGAFPKSWNDAVGPYLPSTAGQALYTMHSDRAMLSPWAGFGMFCLYTAVMLAAAAVVLRRRDA